MTPDEYCQHKTQLSSSSFTYSFLFLDDVQRQAMTALYAFCREVDDIVDKCTNASQTDAHYITQQNVAQQSVAQQKLHWWRGEVSNLYQHQATHPVTRALSHALERYPLKQKHLIALIDGMEMDLHYHSYASFDQLHQYCYRAASVVGLLSIEIFGYTNQQTQEYAKHLGIALQLINILRDVKEDAARGRLYIPLDELDKFGIDAKQLLANDPSVIHSEAMQQLLAHQAQRAQHYYQLAFDQLPEEDRYAQRTGIIMAEIYKALLDKIVAKQYPIFDARQSLPRLKKLWLAWRTARREYRQFTQRQKQHA